MGLLGREMLRRVPLLCFSLPFSFSLSNVHGRKGDEEGFVSFEK